MERPMFAPGCFGSALLKTEDETCRACPVSADCDVVHKIALAEMRQFFGIEDPKKKAAQLPIKAKAVFDALNMRAEDIRSILLSGKNPFKLKGNFIGVACQIFLMRPNVTRALLALTFEDHFKTSAKIADTNARFALQILDHVSAIVETETGYALKRPDQDK